LSLIEKSRADMPDDLLFKNSFPMDWGRRFRVEAGQQLVTSVLTEMRRGEQRVRRRRATAEARHRASVEALLANLFAASVNVSDPYRFVAVSFDRSAYAGTDLHVEAMAQCRDYLEGEGLVMLGRGFRGYEYGGSDDTWGRRSRMQATDLLRDRFDELLLDRKALTVPRSQLIRIKEAAGTASDCPDGIAASRDLLEAINQRLAGVTIGIDLPFGSISIVGEDGRGDADHSEPDVEAVLQGCYAGDLTATSLYRSFIGNWASGGRLYGGWWISVKRDLRPHLTIDGAPTVELDYKTLHPRLLYHREGRPLHFDPYTLPALPSDQARELGKRTFNRLLNTTARKGRNRLKVRAGNGDNLVLPPTWTFERYVDALVERLAPIHQWFGTGEGVRLQKEDSELALAVLRRMEDAAVPVLPIHDSFVVAEQHRNLLWSAMHDAFRERYGFDPAIHDKPRRSQ
jgi:hypothetical protein